MVLPADWLRGGKSVGQDYTAWNTYGQGRPDLGKGSGPGEPYHEVKKKVAKPSPPINNKLPSWPGGGPPKVGGDQGFDRDPRLEAIRRRLGWLK